MKHIMAAVLIASLSVVLPVAFAEDVVLPASAHGTDQTAKADQLIAKGLEFLKSKQNADGGFGDAKAPPAITALALRAFAREGIVPSKADHVERGYQYLLSQQLTDGGIYKDLLANYNTAIAVSSLAAANDPRFKEPIDRAVAYLKGLQWTPETRPEYSGKEGEKVAESNQGKQVVKDENDAFYGGWGYGGRSRGAGRPDLSNAQLAIDALHDAGIKADDPAMQRALAFLTRCQNFSETNDRAWAGNDGGFVYGPADNREGESSAGEYVDASGKRMLRSYGSMTYAGLKSMIYAGLSKDDPRVKAAFDWVQSNWTLDINPGMQLANPDSARQGLYYYYLTLGRALNECDTPLLALPDGKQVDWRRELIDKLAALQQSDGSWSGEKRWMESDPVLVTAYAVQALQEARDDLKERE
jgi:squalene-hopene/tetraprenyl-beta-curcumene cyclase